MQSPVSQEVVRVQAVLRRQPELKGLLKKELDRLTNEDTSRVGSGLLGVLAAFNHDPTVCREMVRMIMVEWGSWTALRYVVCP